MVNHTDCSKLCGTMRLFGENTKTYMQKMKGIAAAFGCVLFYTTSAACVQLLERRIPDFELNTFRASVTLTFYFSYFLFTWKLPVVERSEIGTTVLYMVTMFITTFGTYVSVSLLPASSACSLQYVASIVSALILFSVFWEEKITMKKLLFAFICVVGVVMVTQPKFRQTDLATGKNNTFNDTVFHPDKSSKTELINESITLERYKDIESVKVKKLLDNFEENIKPNTLFGQIVGITAAVNTGIFFSLTVLVTKRNPYIIENIPSVLFWTFIGHVPISVGFMLLMETPVLPRDWFDTVMIIVHSCTCPGLFALYIYGPKYISGNTFTLILTTDVISMLIVQYTVLSSILPGHRNWMEVVGVIFVLLGCSMSAIIEIIKGT